MGKVAAENVQLPGPVPTGNQLGPSLAPTGRTEGDEVYFLEEGDFF